MTWPSSSRSSTATDFLSPRKARDAPGKLVVECIPGATRLSSGPCGPSDDDKDQWLLFEHVRTLLKPRDLTAEDRFGIVVDADHPKAADPGRWIPEALGSR